MRRCYRLIVLCLAFRAATAYPADRQPPAATVEVSSPDERVRVEVAVEPAGNASVLRYRVVYRGRPVVLASRLGVELADGTALGDDSVVEKVAKRSFEEVYHQFPGKRSRVRDHGSEAVIGFREKAAPKRSWELVVRAYDDGAAFRYRFPEQTGWQRLELAAERTEFRLPGDPTTFAMPLPSFTTPHEEHYRQGPLTRFANDQLLGLPLLAELPGTGWAALLEADLTDYAGLYLTRTGHPCTTAAD